MVEEVEEVHQEAQALPLGDAEDLAEAEINVLLRGAYDAVSRRVSEQGCIAISAGRKRGERVGLISSRVHPTGQARCPAAGAQGVATTESWRERCAGRWTGQLIGASACRIENGEGRPGLQNNHGAGLPSA